MTTAVERYDRTTIALHWATAFLVAWQWGQAHVIDLLSTGGTPGRRVMVGLHVVGGITLLLVLLARLAWRHRGGVQLAPDPGLVGLAGRAMHVALYLTLAAVLAAGLWLEWVRGDTLFGLLQIPAYDPGNKALRSAAAEYHDTLANILLVLAGLHAAAALWHHYWLGDGVLRRMLLGR